MMTVRFWRSAAVSIWIASLIWLGAAPTRCLACACGCGVFSVGTSSLFPSGGGFTASVEEDYMNQNQNWNGTASALASQNQDKQIRTHFYTVSVRYMFNRDWGLMARVPYWGRKFVTTLDSGGIGSFQHSALGDIRVMGIYTGFSGDMSTGITFGLKLPTGDYTYPNFDRDTAIGTGTTDLLLGAFHQRGLNANNTWNLFAQGQWERAFTGRDGYRPGSELDAAIGTYYNGWSVGVNSQIVPLLQVLGSYRLRDSGSNADPANSGYTRFLAAPGLEFDTGSFKFYADVEVPFYQKVNGNQLVAPDLFKFIVAYRY